MTKEKKYDLEDRMVGLAADILLFVDKIPNNFSGQYYAKQLMRSAGSAALNFGEMQGSNTSNDFINKASLSLKELKESRINLKILDRVDYGNTNMRKNLINEVDQLTRIIATIINNKKRKTI